MNQQTFKVTSFQLDKFFQQIIEVYGDEINTAGLMGLWNDNVSNVSNASIDSRSNQSNDNVSNGLCQAILQRGPRKNEPCGKKQAKMCEYCSTHAKAKGLITPKTRSTANSTSSNKSVNLKLAIHKTLKCFWDPVSTLVYEKAGTSKVCVGFINDDELCELNDEHISFCNMNNIKMRE
jgi:hypothetical protein